MAKKREPKPPGQWTTLEEMLLAHAVKRHGFESWDAIAKELQSCVAMQRNYVSSVITPQNCRDEFLLLRRRFMPSAAAETAEESCLVPMLDELRRIRIEELRREVKQHDASIVSLESKIKRLEEERERSLAEETDLASDREEMDASPAILAGEFSATVSAAADDSDDRSFNESNSTGQKPELAMATKENQNDAVKARISSAKREPAGETGPNPVHPRTEPDRDRDPSARFRTGPNNDAVKRGGGEAELAVVKATRSGRLGGSNELMDSVSETKREAASSKQNSDVQSSASLSRKKRRRNGRAAARDGGAASSGEDELEANEVSPVAQKRVAAVKPPQPVVDLLRKIRSHRLGSAFERRVRIQESERYKNLIRQRMDLQVIQSRLERGAYSDWSTMFYRDLLLLFNNAIVFHSKTSSEYTAAVELRALVTKSITKATTLGNRPPAASVASSKSSKPIKPPVSIAPLKSKACKPVIGACATRSSLKPTTGKKIEELKKQEVVVIENKDDVRRSDGSMIVAAGTCKKERSCINNGGSNKNSMKKKKESNNNVETKKQEHGKYESSSHNTPMSKSANAKKNEKKRQGVVSFLRRMKQIVSSDSDGDGHAEEDVSGGGGEREQKWMDSRGKRRERMATRSASSSLVAGKLVGKEEKEKGKKNTGRAVKGTAGTSATTAGETAGKRAGRENNGVGSGGGGGGGGGGGRAKKRVKR